MLGRKLNLILLALIIGLTGCEKEAEEELLSDGSGSQNLKNLLQLTLNGIEPATGQHYEGWLVTDEETLSTGRFNLDTLGAVFAVDSLGNRVQDIGDVNAANFQLNTYKGKISSFILTIEPNGDTDLGPSSVHYVAGNFNDDVLALAKTDHASAIGTRFNIASGAYILSTPTNGPSTSNQGLWYYDGNLATLDLPTLNTGWTYQGWIIDNSTGEMISTGTFLTPDESDSDGAGASAGPDPVPPHPGQDFLSPPRILNDGNHVAVISVEPSPDFDPAPFTLKILSGEIELDATTESIYGMDTTSNDSTIYIEAVLK